MANADTPRGAWPIRHQTGGTIRASEHTIASAFGTDIFRGDFVKLVAGGGIEDADAGDRLIGVFQGCDYTNAAGEVIFSKYWPASTVATYIKAYVFDDPRIIFGIQSAGSTVAADVGTLANHVAGSGSTTTGLSAHEINGTTSTAYAGLRVIGKDGAPNNDWGTNVNLEVTIYEHEYGSSLEATTPGV
tara:strand:- start:1075 stop:1638 length:564 start_codon:yes stop_codon:yes gene_type:complete